MTKRDAWENAFYLFLVGYIIVFWAAAPEILGMWIGACLTYGFNQASKCEKYKSDAQLKAEREHVDCGKLKEFVNDVIFYDHKSGEKYPWCETKSMKYSRREAAELNEKRMMYITKKIVNDPEMAQRFFSEENLTPEELHNLKTRWRIPNKFTEEEKELCLYPYLRGEDYFLIGDLITPVGFEVDENKEFPDGCYKKFPKQLDRSLAFLNEKFKEVNGHDLSD